MHKDEFSVMGAVCALQITTLGMNRASKVALAANSTPGRWNRAGSGHLHSLGDSAPQILNNNMSWDYMERQLRHGAFKCGQSRQVGRNGDVGHTAADRAFA